MDRFRIQTLEKIINNKSLDKQEKQMVLNTLLKKLNILLIGARKRNKDISVLVDKIEKYEKIKNHEFTN